MEKIHVGNGIVYAAVIRAATATKIGAVIIMIPFLIIMAVAAGILAWDLFFKMSYIEYKKEQANIAANAEVEGVIGKPRVAELVKIEVIVASDYYDPYAAKNKDLRSNLRSSDGRLAVMKYTLTVTDPIPADETNRINEGINKIADKGCQFIHEAGHQVCNVIATGRQPFKKTVSAAKVKEIQTAKVKAERDATAAAKQQKLAVEQAKQAEIAKALAEKEKAIEARNAAAKAKAKAEHAEWQAEQEAEFEQRRAKNQAKCVAEGGCKGFSPRMMELLGNPNAKLY